MIFSIAAWLSVIPILFALFVLPEPHKPLDSAHDGEADAPASQENSDDRALGPNAGERAAAAPSSAACTPRLVILVAIALLINFTAQGTHSLLILYITNRFPECEEECISLVFSLFSVSFAVCSLVYIPVAIRVLGTRATLMLGLAFSSLCLACYALASKLDTIFMTFALEVPALAIQSCLTALFTESVPRERVGHATGLLMATQTLAQVVSPVVFAFLLTSWLRSDV